MITRLRAHSWVATCLLTCAICLQCLAEDTRSFTKADREYWAFVKPRRFTPPKVRWNAWVNNPIDAFVLSKLEASGIKPSPTADRRTLIRRVSFDLTGLPPKPEDVDAFINDSSPDAYEKLVNRLLSSPQYGERWARHWLDLARYAESEGFKSDETRPNAWRYRDYVIRALNEDKPYDRFIMEQIAGDEIAPDDPWAAVATAFNRNYADESNARNLFLRRQDILNDITDTTGAVFLGLTIGCARCHDHKFDPILQKDYYRLQAFFAAVHASDEIPMASRQEMSEYREKLREWEVATRDLRAQISAIETKVRDGIFLDSKEKFPSEIQKAIDTKAEQRSPLDALIADKAAPQLSVTSKAMAAKMSPDVREQYEGMLKRLDALVPKPPDPPFGIGVTDIGPRAPKHYVLTRGVWDAQAEEVEPGFLTILQSDPPTFPPPKDGARTTGRRTALANWIASRDNPLTARVMVNRIFRQHFGQGIVETPSDFGIMGETPTHPELLDWLATEFMRQGWSLKAMHRLILNSNTYKQSSRMSLHTMQASALSVDPRNRLRWRGPMVRLEAEAVRDAMIAVSGALNVKMLGPSVFPELPSGVSTRAGWPVTVDTIEHNRRSIYIFVRRNLRYPLLDVFDGPDTNETCARRNVTTTPAQALTLLNSELVMRFAQGFAGRVLKEAGRVPSRQIARAYEIAFSRQPDEQETLSAMKFLVNHAELARSDQRDGRSVLMPAGAFADMECGEGAALVDFCHALMNVNEFLYVQ